MTLNVKDPEAHKLAKAIQRETGETLTLAVVEALRERLERVRRQRKEKRLAEELAAISRRYRAAMKGPPIDHAAFLYDERGLPR